MSTRHTQRTVSGAFEIVKALGGFFGALAVITKIVIGVNNYDSNDRRDRDNRRYNN